MVVGIDRKREIPGGGAAPHKLRRPLEHVPAAIRPGGADIGDEEIAGRTVKARSPRIAQAERPDLVGASLTHERIVRRNGVIARRVGGESIAVHVEAQYLPEKALDVLPGTEWIAGAAAV